MKTILFKQLSVLTMILALIFLWVSCTKEDVSPSGNGGPSGTESSGPKKPSVGISETSSVIIYLPGKVVNVLGKVPAPGTSVIYNPYNMTQISAPGGKAITYDEFTGVQATAEVKCGNTGGELSIHFHHLIPNAVYTMWIQAFRSPGFDGTFANAIGFCADGINARQCSFKASGSGEGQFTATIPLRNLLAGYLAGDCIVTSVFEYQIIADYQLDNQACYPNPASGAYAVEHFRIVFRHE